jgi:probable F420-dependent oxidoreductase
MKLGFSLPVSGGWATPDNMVAIAEAAENLGYHSLWTVSRLLYALDPLNDYPQAPGQPWPSVFKSVDDALAVLSFIAAKTSRIRLGTAVLNFPYYSPAMLAKQLATIDRLSSGRLTVGAGLGWSQDEYLAAGVSFRRRGARMDEFLRCLKHTWTDTEVSFHGDFYEIPRSLVEPKPVQTPHPPVLVGGYAQATMRRAVTHADGYIGGNVPLSEVAPLLDTLSAVAARHGRASQDLQLVSRGSLRVHDKAQGRQRRPLFGSVEEIRADIDRYREAGLTELFLELNFDPSFAALDADPSRCLEKALWLMEELKPTD